MASRLRLACRDALASTLVPSRDTTPTRIGPAAAHSRRTSVKHAARACSFAWRNRAMVLWSGAVLAVITRKAMSSWHRRSILRLERSPVQ